MSLEDYFATRQAMHQATADFNELHRAAALSGEVQDLKARESYLVDAISWHKSALSTMREEIEQELLDKLRAEEAAKDTSRQEIEQTARIKFDRLTGE